MIGLSRKRVNPAIVSCSDTATFGALVALSISIWYGLHCTHDNCYELSCLFDLDNLLL